MPVIHTIIERQDRSRRGSIVFVHGLGGDHFSTWGGKEGNDQGYLLTWLKDDLPSYSIHAVSYGAEVSARQGNTVSLADLGRGLLETLQSHAKITSGPIALVGHSLGGLVIKHMLKIASEHRDAAGDEHPIAQNLRQVVFIATPHRGSAVAASAMKLVVHSVVQPSRLVQALNEDDDALAELNDAYRDFCTAHPDVRNKVYYETRKTPVALGGWISRHIVDKQSANPELPGVRPIPINSDHIEICKPLTRQGELYQPLCAFLNDLSAEARPSKSGRKSASTPKAHAAWLEIHGLRYTAIAAAIVAALAAGGLALKSALPADSSASESMTKQVEVTSVHRLSTAEKRLDDERVARENAEKERRARLEKDEQERRETALKQERDRLARQLREEQDAKRAHDEALAEVGSGTDRKRLREITLRYQDLAPHVERRLQALDQADAEERTRLTRSIQEALKRTGCFNGPVNGNWGPLTKAAATRFNKYSSEPIAIDHPSPDTDSLLLAIKSRTCPLSCEPPKIEQNGSCITASPAPAAHTGCLPDQLRLTNGTCGPAYVAWIGSDPTETGASTLFTGLVSRHPDLLNGRSPSIKPSDDGTRYSVRIGPATSRDAVLDLCTSLKAAGLKQKCYPAPL